MRSEAPRVDQLPDDALLQVLALLELEDLLHLSRTAVRLRTLVATRAEPAWEALYRRSFLDTDALPDGSTWARHYRERHVREAKGHRLKRRLKVMRAQSTVQELERDVRNVKQKIRATAEDAQRMAAEQQALERTREAQVALSSAWQPEAVRSRQQQLLAQKPIEPRWRVAALQHARADAEVHLRGLHKSLNLRQQQLARKRKVLEALQEA